MTYEQDPAVIAARERTLSFFRCTCRPGSDICGEVITDYGRAVAIAVLREVRAAPTDHIRKQVMARLLAELEAK